MEQEKMNFYKNGLISIKAFYSIAWLFVAGILSLFIFVILESVGILKLLHNSVGHLRQIIGGFHYRVICDAPINF